MKYYNQTTEPLLRNLRCAREILKEFWILNSESRLLQSQAKKEREEAKSANRNRWIVPLLSLGTVFAFQIIGVVITVVITIIFWLPRNSPKAHLKKAEECEKQIQEKNKRISILTQKYSDALKLIPKKYWHPAAAEFLIRVIQSGRVATLPAALRLLEEQVCRRRVELEIQREEGLREQWLEEKENEKNLKRVSEGFNIAMDIVDMLDDIISPIKDDWYLDDFD